MRETSLSQSCRGCPCKVLLYDSGVVERPIASILSTRARSVNFLLVTLRYRDIRDTRKGMLKQSLSKRGDEGMRHSCCCCCCPCPRINPVTRKRNFRKKSIRWMPSSRISCVYIYIYIRRGRKESLFARFCRETIRWNRATHRTEHRPRDIDCPINNVTTWRGRLTTTSSGSLCKYYTWFFEEETASI